MSLDEIFRTLKAIDVAERSIKVLLTDENLPRYGVLHPWRSAIQVEVPSLLGPGFAHDLLLVLVVLKKELLMREGAYPENLPKRSLKEESLQ